MKKIVSSIVFIFLFFSISSFSQTKDLTSKELRVFNMQSLGVDEGAKASGFGSVSSYGNVSYSGESWKTWKGYYGSEKISEARFFEVAGYH